MCQAVVNWVCWGSSRHYQEYRPRLPQGCTDSQIKNMGTELLYHRRFVLFVVAE